MSDIPDRRERHLQAHHGAFVGLRGVGFRPDMIGHGVGVAHHLGQPVGSGVAGLSLQKAWTLAPFAFERVAVVGESLLRGAVLIRDTLNVALAY
ncbi:hypothetical protein QYF68_00835 [Mycolicibacterium austroafricanum]|uniref:Thioesterase n=1 Tax=Mycolicibacterium austroafricanum TaxID=39687 RepID=A0ABT8H6I3_MYCAO|nr:hypothetical protein [Mycolicibacterium austroafricanum]MDN4516373.1 hypothetical protein [Mycolicibacterium austroafricanum]